MIYTIIHLPPHINKYFHIIPWKTFNNNTLFISSPRALGGRGLPPPSVISLENRNYCSARFFKTINAVVCLTLWWGAIKGFLFWQKGVGKCIAPSCMHRKKKGSHFDLKSTVTGGTKIRTGIPSDWRTFESN